MEKQLRKILFEKGVGEELIELTIQSGYIIRDWVDPFSGKTWKSVSDKFYGSKGISSNFEIDKFIKYIQKEPIEFPKFPFVTYRAKSFEDIQEILNTGPRKNLIDIGKMSFRGQSREYLVSRKIPNPIRCDESGSEISVMPGIYRNQHLGESKLFDFDYKSSFKYFLKDFEPNAEDPAFAVFNSYDMMRVEQHYATNTPGLDITFDIHSALFFATHKYEKMGENTATYKKIERGNHQGCIYCFVFTDPPVKKTQYYVDSFDFFKTNSPERILRQSCGLPLLSEYERNIAITDLNCIIYLDSDFNYSNVKSYEFMFPNTEIDLFYKKALELKKKYPDKLKNLVEYI